jgi:hypothetical protein
MSTNHEITMATPARKAQEADVLRATQTGHISRTTHWAGYSISTFAILFLLFDGVIKILEIAPVVESFTLLGYPASTMFGIGILLLACVAVYMIPRTSILGAILLTGYLGGAIASHVRIGSEPFSLIFPLIIGALLWGGLFLRDNRVRACVSVRG